jgi:hypothetical protein
MIWPARLANTSKALVCVDGWYNSYQEKGTVTIIVTANIRRFTMAKSIVWVVVVILLLALPGSRILPNVFSNFPIMGIYILVPYVWLLVLSIMSLVRSIRKSPTET